MKKRNPLAVFLLSIITLGIYDLYWLVKTKKVLNQRTGHHTPSIWLLIAPAALTVSGYVLLFVGAGLKHTSSYTSTYWNNGSTSDQVAHPGMFAVSIGLIIIGFLASFLISAIWFYKFSKAVNQYTQGKMNTAVAFLILWLIHLIGVALIQDTFNDMEEGGVGASQPLQATNGVASSIGAQYTPQPPISPQVLVPPSPQAPPQTVDPSHEPSQDSPQDNNTSYPA